MNTNPDIKLLYFPGCPNVEETREITREVAKSLGIAPAIQDINVQAPSCPEKYRNWPSPSLLVNGEDVEGAPEKNNAACRIYPGNRTPRKEKIRRALKKTLEV